MASNPEEKLNNFWYMMQVLAAGRTAEGSDEWAYRRITREYAQKFNEPLAKVRTMPFQDVLLEVLEARLDNVKRSDLMEFVRDLTTDGDLDAKKAEERLKRYEEEEKERLARVKTRKPKHKKQKISFAGTAAPKSELIPQIQKTYSMGDPDKE